MRELQALAQRAVIGGLLFAVLIGPCAWLAGTRSVGDALLAATLASIALAILIVKTEDYKTFEAQVFAILLVIFGPIVGGIGAVFGRVFGPFGGVVALAGIGALLGVLELATGASKRAQRKK